MEAIDHLRNVLYFVADLHPDYRCHALDEALAFYNATRPLEQVGPSDHGWQKLVSIETRET